MNPEFRKWFENAYGVSVSVPSDNLLKYNFSILALECAWEAGAKSAETRANDVDDFYRGKD